MVVFFRKQTCSLPQRQKFKGSARLIGILVYSILFLQLDFEFITKQNIRVEAFPSFSKLFSLGNGEKDKQGGSVYKNREESSSTDTTDTKEIDSVTGLFDTINHPKLTNTFCGNDNTLYEDWLDRYDYNYIFNFSSSILSDSDYNSVSSNSFSTIGASDPMVQNILTSAYNESMEWGTYRPGHYFEVKSRSEPYFLLTGIGWHGGEFKVSDMRYECRQEDGIQKYGWLEHDGRYYGKQEIVDPKQNSKLTIYFVKPDQLPNPSFKGKDKNQDEIESSIFSRFNQSLKWITKISVEAIDSEGPPPTVYIYTGLDCDGYITDSDCSFNIFKSSDGFSIGHSKKGKSFTTEKEASDSCFNLESEVMEHFVVSGENEKYGKFRLYINSIIDDFQSSSPSSINIEDTEGTLTTKSWIGYTDNMSDMKGKIEKVMEEEYIIGRQKNSAIIRISSSNRKFTINLGFESHVQNFENEDEHIDSDTFDEKTEGNEIDDNEEFIEKIPSSVDVLCQALSKYIDLYSIPVARSQFSKRFENIYKLEGKGYIDSDDKIIPFTSTEIEAGKLALSNMIGSLGYFSGKIPIKSDIPSELFESFHTSLFTAVPSRSFFPRGFLWDEGFHQMLIMNWDERITYDVILHWFSNQHGKKKCPEAGAWIPREIAIGNSAKRRIPFEYLAQDPTVANPTSMLLVIEKILEKALELEENKKNEEEEVKGEKNYSNNFQNQDVNSIERKEFLRHIYPRVRAWMDWFLQSQQGSLPGSFRWRGRDPNEPKLHPNTLASGLDDYPRASVPDNIEERHVDLLCWIIKACQVTSKLAVFAGDIANSNLYQNLADELMKSLHRLHWDEQNGAHFDYGTHSNNAQIIPMFEVVCRNLETREGMVYLIPAESIARQNPDDICPPQYNHFQGVKSRTPTNHLVPGNDLGPSFVIHFGYVALFPFLLQLLNENDTSNPANNTEQTISSSKIGRLLSWIKNPSIGIWSEYGLRSLASSDPYYLVENAPGDAPYWRGYIWININYLAIRALHICAKDTTSIYRNQCWTLYKELRNNVLKTILSSYERTGYLWEQYDDRTGEGRRCHPFTGWSALVLNIMAEIY